MSESMGDNDHSESSLFSKEDSDTLVCDRNHIIHQSSISAIIAKNPEECHVKGKRRIAFNEVLENLSLDDKGKRLETTTIKNHNLSRKLVFPFRKVTKTKCYFGANQLVRKTSKIALLTADPNTTKTTVKEHTCDTENLRSQVCDIHGDVSLLFEKLDHENYFSSKNKIVYQSPLTALIAKRPSHYIVSNETRNPAKGRNGREMVFPFKRVTTDGKCIFSEKQLIYHSEDMIVLTANPDSHNVKVKISDINKRKVPGRESVEEEESKFPFLAEDANSYTFKESMIVFQTPDIVVLATLPDMCKVRQSKTLATRVAADEEEEASDVTEDKACYHKTEELQLNQLGKSPRRASVESINTEIHDISGRSHRNRVDILNRPKDFLQLPVDDLIEMLCGEHTAVMSEYELFKATTDWLRHKKRERASDAERVLGCIRFGLMSSKEISKCAARMRKMDWLAHMAPIDKAVYEGLLWRSAVDSGQESDFPELAPMRRQPLENSEIPR